MEQMVDILAERGTLDDEGLRRLLETEDEAVVKHLHERAQEVAVERFGRQVYLRALIEWSNVCRNDCLYCGIRKSNHDIRRYALSREEILACCEKAWALGIKTFVLQGGENPPAAEALAALVAEIRAAWPEAAITLSLGELPFETFALLRKSGADRYLLRHETASAAHYEKLHPTGMRLETRMACLRELKRLGFQTGAGMMVGSPFQTTEDLVRDVRFLAAFRPEMIGMGPFIPQKDTPMKDFPPGSAEKTLRLYSVLRLMLPDALIPSTTALSTLRSDGRVAGILAGANVLMPVFTPPEHRADYALYDGKCSGQLQQIEKELSAIGYAISPSRGDHLAN